MHKFPAITLRIMKVTIPLVILLIFGCIAIAGCISATNNAAPATTAVPQETRPHYVIGVDADFPPFTSQDSTGNFSGFDIEAARAVAAQEGFDVTFVAIPWDMAISSLESRQIDLIWSGMTISPERSALVNFSVPYYRVNQSIAVREGSGFTLQDFAAGRLRIGVQTGSTETEYVQVNLIDTGILPAASVTEYRDVAMLTGALVNGSVDATLVQAPTQANAIRGKPLVIIGKTGALDSYAVGIRKTDTALQASIDRGLARLMDNPAWQEMKKQYGLA